MDTTPDSSDEAVARAVQAGDQEQFGHLVDRYETKLKRYGKKFLAHHDDIDDIVQDVFISAFRAIQSFDTAERFSPWIYRIAHNAFVNALRKQKHSPLSIDFDTLLSYPAPQDTAEKERDRAEFRQLIDRGLAELAPKYREVLVLHYYEDLSYKDIAQVLKVPIGTVGIRLSRAKDALKGHLTHAL
jgi:RNA polymerase sigma-70 factor (ECF subfamily)